MDLGSLGIGQILSCFHSVGNLTSCKERSNKYLTGLAIYAAANCNHLLSRKVPWGFISRSNNRTLSIFKAKLHSFPYLIFPYQYSPPVFMHLHLHVRPDIIHLCFIMVCKVICNIYWFCLDVSINLHTNRIISLATHRSGFLKMKDSVGSFSRV